MSHAVSIKQLRAFLEVARSGSFASAADRLCLTPSALTATIQQLEAAVGVRLFDRTTRRVALADHAAEFRNRAERLLSGLDSAVCDMQALAHGRRGHLCIAAATSVIDQFLRPVLRTFRQQYPDITISLRNPAAQEVERQVLEGEVDFAIDSRYENFGDLSYLPLIKDSYGVVCHRSLAAPAAIDLNWATRHAGRYVGLSGQTGIGHFLRTQLPSFPEGQTLHDEVESTSYLFDFLAEGDRFSILPALSFQPKRHPELQWIELHQPRLLRELCVMTRPLRALSPSAQRLLDLLRSTLAKHPLPTGVTLA